MQSHLSDIEGNRIMIQDRLTELAIFLLRVALGLMFIAHSLLLKLVVFGLPATAAFFGSIGLPPWLAYGVFGMEILGGVMLVLGIHARWSALALLPIVAGAVWVHAGNGWVFTSANGGWEYPLYLCLLCAVQAMLGDGAYALVRSAPITAPSRAIATA
jgi:putative oxidoreductase